VKVNPLRYSNLRNTRQCQDCENIKKIIFLPTYHFRVQLGLWIRTGNPDPDPGKQKLAYKKVKKKRGDSSCFEELDVLFSGL
jgi:hypothetical protein